DVSIKGQLQAFAQASGNLSVVAGTALSDVTAACKNMATDLGDDATAGDTKGAGADLLNFWCGEATAKINATFTATGTAKGSLTLNIEPPKCEVSVSAQAKCQGGCDVSGKCDIKANPPTCTGGTLEVDCKGSCDVSASAPKIDCTGSCGGSCSGDCTAQGGVAVDCQGTCSGHCTVDGTANGASAVQADGSCKGKCDATCTASATAPAVKCSGQCKGKCDASCTATPGQASVQCSGKCSVDAQPISCKGGKLEGGCKVDASCQANCNASAQASASCTPPSVKVGFSGSVTASAQGQFSALVTTIQTNLPALLLVIQAQGQAILTDLQAAVDGGVSITASGKLDVKSGACLAQMVASMQPAFDNFQAALTASVSVSGTVGGPGT
ncbi:MAG: hypothetical protein ABI551_18350, partial [Polyangiaceae bacterium]